MVLHETFAALGEANRSAIVALLAEGERSSGEIAAHFKLPAPGVSQHLRVLKQAGVVQVRAQAQQRFYSLNRAALAEAAAWLIARGKFWTTRLDALEAILKEGDDHG